MTRRILSLESSPAPGRLTDAERRREPEVTVVVPAYNEEASLSGLWERLRPVLEALGLSWEAIFVDDGSADRTAEVLTQIRSREPRVRVLRLKENRGQSAALDAGFRAARGGWIVTLDADLQNPPEEITRLFAAAEQSDLVFGRRRERMDGLLKRISSRIGNRTRDIITGHRVQDTGCSLKLFRSECLRRIPRFDGMHRFLPTLFVFHGFSVREVEVAHEPRSTGATKYGVLDRGWRGLIDCLAVRWMRRRCLRYEVEELGEPDHDGE